MDVENRSDLFHLGFLNEKTTTPFFLKKIALSDCIKFFFGSLGHGPALTTVQYSHLR
jgi:hypothetical protein